MDTAESSYARTEEHVTVVCWTRRGVWWDVVSVHQTCSQFFAVAAHHAALELVLDEEQYNVWITGCRVGVGGEGVPGTEDGNAATPGGGAGDSHRRLVKPSDTWSRFEADSRNRISVRILERNGTGDVRRQTPPQPPSIEGGTIPPYPSGSTESDYGALPLLRVVDRSPPSAGGHFSFICRAKLAEEDVDTVISNDDSVSREVAVKLLRPHCYDDVEVLTEAWFGYEAQSKQVCPYLVRTFGVCENSDGTLGIVMGFIDGEPISKPLLEGTSFSERTKLRWCREVATAVQHLHARNFTHGDIRARNVLIRRSSDSDGHAVLVDMGLVRMIGMDHKDLFVRFHARITLQLWLPPEAIDGLPWTSESDIWCCGISFAEIFLDGNHPLIECASADASGKDTERAVRQQLRQRRILREWKYSEDIREFIEEKCLAILPQKRLAAVDVIQGLQELEAAHSNLAFTSRVSALLTSIGLIAAGSGVLPLVPCSSVKGTASSAIGAALVGAGAGSGLAVCIHEGPGSYIQFVEGMCWAFCKLAPSQLASCAAISCIDGSDFARPWKIVVGFTAALLTDNIVAWLLDACSRINDKAYKETVSSALVATLQKGGKNFLPHALAALPSFMLQVGLAHFSEQSVTCRSYRRLKDWSRLGQAAWAGLWEGACIAAGLLLRSCWDGTLQDSLKLKKRMAKVFLSVVCVPICVRCVAFGVRERKFEAQRAEAQSALSGARRAVRELDRKLRDAAISFAPCEERRMASQRDFKQEKRDILQFFNEHRHEEIRISGVIVDKSKPAWMNRVQSKMRRPGSVQFGTQLYNVVHSAAERHSSDSIAVNRVLQELAEIGSALVDQKNCESEQRELLRRLEDRAQDVRKVPPSIVVATVAVASAGEL